MFYFIGNIISKTFNESSLWTAAMFKKYITNLGGKICFVLSSINHTYCLFWRNYSLSKIE
jgi:hypothetical protein